MNDKLKKLGELNHYIYSSTYKEIWDCFNYEDSNNRDTKLNLCYICNGSNGGIISYQYGYYGEYICICAECLKELENHPNLNEKIVTIDNEKVKKLQELKEAMFYDNFNAKNVDCLNRFNDLSPLKCYTCGSKSNILAIESYDSIIGICDKCHEELKNLPKSYLAL